MPWLPRWKTPLRYLLASSMVAIGVTHFVKTAEFAAIMPAALPAPVLLVQISGLCEIAGGVGLLLRPTQVAAAWGLVALYVAVFPANINMAVNDIYVDGVAVPPVLLWLRLPFQAVFIAWAWWYTRPEPKS